METIQNSGIPSSDYRDLPLAQLFESPATPRKRYDQASLEELAESIRSQGVLAPLLVRAGVVEAVAKRYRVNVGKIAESVSAEFAARRKKSKGRRKMSSSGQPSGPSKTARRRTRL